MFPAGDAGTHVRLLRLRRGPSEIYGPDAGVSVTVAAPHVARPSLKMSFCSLRRAIYGYDRFSGDLVAFITPARARSRIRPSRDRTRATDTGVVTASIPWRPRAFVLPRVHTVT